MIEKTGLNIIASGGASTLEDIKSVKKIGARGFIIGQALYTGAIKLEDALGFEGD
jgi:phosphoribosylformimino-5-aminoimidazole carboxamide ribotide isomerase